MIRTNEEPRRLFALLEKFYDVWPFEALPDGDFVRE